MPTRFANTQEAFSAWEQDRAQHEENGIYIGARSYLPEPVRRNAMLANEMLAMDAAYQPGLATDPNSGVPAMLTTYIDPAIFEILFSPSKAAIILGEKRYGDWITDTAMFPVTEATGEVSSYGDSSMNGRAGVNTNWPQFQNYLFQTIMEYGERELARAGLAKINWVSQINAAAATIMQKYANVTYFFGVRGLRNYGLLNNPYFAASLTPATKANGGQTWFTNTGAPNATANEVYNDIVTMFESLVQQTGGLADKDTKVVLAMSPGSEVALTFTNSFNVNVEDLLKKNFPNIRIENAVQYGVQSASNPQGVVGGNLVQLFAESLEGQESGYCGFSEKMRSHTIVKGLSDFRQKVTGGTWGAVIRMPVSFVSMLGV